MTKTQSKSWIHLNIFHVLTAVFVVLKLTDKIDWSWWWVFSPILIPLGLLVTLAVSLIILAIIAPKT